MWILSETSKRSSNHATKDNFNFKMFTSVHAVTLVACDTFSITKCTYFYSRVLVLPHPPLDIFIEAAGSLLSGSLQPVRQKALNVSVIGTDFLALKATFAFVFIRLARVN